MKVGFTLGTDSEYTVNLIIDKCENAVDGRRIAEQWIAENHPNWKIVMRLDEKEIA